MKHFVLIAGLILSTSLAGGQNPSANGDATEIMRKNFFVSKVSSMQFDSVMTLINDKGQRRERTSTNLVKLQPNGVDSKFLINFSTPADIKGTGFLQVEHIDGDDDLWIYLPALKKSRRLVANNKKDSFVGSDFSYGDISLPKVDKYHHSLLRSETIDGAECYVVESIPADDTVRSNSGYGRKITWVRKDNYLESKVEYYDLANRLLKTQNIQKPQLIDPQKGRWFALYREMTNQQTGHRTTLSIEKINGGVKVPDDLFTVRSIEHE
jgi:outer membrane lipoprotein-sorting protein